MSDANNAAGNEETAKAGPSIGETLRQARMAAGLEVGKVCADLRISAQALEAIEQGNYQQLSGDPYIRAMLGSLGRYLGLDAQALIQGYNKEIGAVAPAPSIAPYKDRAQTYSTAHKQIFVVVVVVLLGGLFFLAGKVNKGQHGFGKTNPPGMGAADSLLLPQDTGLVSRSLAPDSAQGKAPADSGEARPLGAARATHADSLAVKASSGKRSSTAGGANPITNPSQHAAPTPSGIIASTVPKPGASGVKPIVAAGGPPATNSTGNNNPGTSTASATATTAPVPGTGVSSPADTSHMNTVIVKPLIDSVGVKVMRTGKEDFATLLRLGKQMQVSHNDTIVIFISKRKSVEVTLGGKSVIPDRKRFKIYGNILKTY